jgi:rSAM/selenodomain-associated transferase 1
VSKRLKDKRAEAGSNVCALAVMTKAPVAGASKTRLVPPLKANEAAELSACFLRDTCDNIISSSWNTSAAGVAVYTPAGAESLFDRLLPASFGRISQRGSLFGDRLFHATEDLFSLGYDSLCLIDSDSPTLPPAFLQAAISELARPGDRVVLGPAEDGGYYLIGLKKLHRRLFEDVDWSTSRVLVQSVARANEIELPVTLLPSWFDVDDPAALRQLCYELFLKQRRRATLSVPISYQAPHTRRYLKALIEFDGGERIWQNVSEEDNHARGGRRRHAP